MLNKKILIKLVALGLITTSVGMTNTLPAFAYTKDTNTNVQSNAGNPTDTHRSIDMDINGESINVSVDKYSDGGFKVVTTTDSGERHEGTYKAGDNYIVKDGKKIQIEITKEIDPQKATLDSDIMTMASNSYTPVYVCSNKITAGDVVTTISDAIWLVSSILSFGSTGITTAAIKSALTKAGNAAGAAAFANAFFDAYVKYDQYRTTDQFYTSYSGIYQYMYRTQNYKLGGSVGVRNLTETVISSSPSSWYFASRPV